jgi:adenylylsulfate kinase
MDGDNVRHGLCSDLGFSSRDRAENIRRIGEVAKLFLEAGVLTLTAFISPFRIDRERVRSLFSTEDMLEFYCRCDLQICEARDVKGLYQRARTGEISNFTGISSRYEEPINPELTIDTGRLSIVESTDLVLQLLRKRGVLPIGESDAISTVFK